MNNLIFGFKKEAILYSAAIVIFGVVLAFALTYGDAIKYGGYIYEWKHSNTKNHVVPPELANAEAASMASAISSSDEVKMSSFIALTVKKFHRMDTKNKESFSVDIEVKNIGNKEISAFTGMLYFYDAMLNQVGDPVLVSSEKTIKPNEIVLISNTTEQSTIDGLALYRSDLPRADLSQKKHSIKFKPNGIVFTDGVKIGL